MEKISYQIRTVRNTPVYSLDDLDRAIKEKESAEKRVGCKMMIVRITQTEEVLSV